MTLVGLTPKPKVTRRGDDLLSMYFSTIAQTVCEICVTKVFQFLALGGLTPGPKFTKRGDDLLDSEIYHHAKFHRSTPTHARDILYKILRRDTHKKTSTPVNPTGVYHHMPIAVTAPFVTLTFNLSRSSKVKPMGATSLTVVVLGIFHVEKFDLDF